MARAGTAPWLCSKSTTLIEFYVMPNSARRQEHDVRLWRRALFCFQPTSANPKRGWLRTY